MLECGLRGCVLFRSVIGYDSYDLSAEKEVLCQGRSYTRLTVDCQRLAHASFTVVAFVSGDYTNMYDWFVVYNNFSASEKENLLLNYEQRTYHPDGALLLIYKLFLIQYYGTDYVQQFAHILIGHELRIFTYLGVQMLLVGVWYYGQKNYYHACLSALRQARKFVLSEYSLGTMLSCYIVQDKVKPSALPCVGVWGNK